MKSLVKIVIFSCLVASSLCIPLSGNFTTEFSDEFSDELTDEILNAFKDEIKDEIPRNISDEFTGKFVDCEIIPEEKTWELLRQDSVQGRQGRIVYGSLAQANQFPHFGYLSLFRPTRSLFCGSALISTTWVVSAAHCLGDVYGGQALFGSTNKLAMTVSRNIKRYIIHPYYNGPSPLANDIVLVELTSAVSLSNSVKVIKLPTRAEVAKNFAGTTMVASGFGVTLSGSVSSTLQYTYLTGLTFNECKAAHGVFIDSMLCGKSATGSSICGGDSGGPLISSGSIPTLIGVNSYVQTASCVNDVQGFTRIDSYLDWISYYTGIFISW